MHLTNYSLNKNSVNFDKDTDEARGSKRSLSSVMSTLEGRGCDTKLLWKRICEIVNRTLLCVQPALGEAYQSYFGGLRRRPVGRAGLGRLGLEDAKLSACMEILGIDILIDHKLQPWLLEVNHMPSFASGSALDRRIKTQVLNGAFQLLCPTPVQKHNFMCSERKRKKKLFDPLRKRKFSKQPGDNDQSQRTVTAMSKTEGIVRSAALVSFAKNEKTRNKT